MTDAQVKRAGLTITRWPMSPCTPDLATAWDRLRPERVFAFTAHARSRHTDIAYQPGDVLLFARNRPACPTTS